jgi:splicing factor 3B subunit 4
LDPLTSEKIVWELMTQVGPVISIVMPRDRITGKHGGYAFVEFESPEDAEYAIRVMNNVKLYGKMIRVSKAMKEDKVTRDAQDWMVKLFVGSLAPEVDEKILSDVFSNFGALLSCSINMDPDTGKSKGFAFLTFDTFEAGDAAIAALDGQYLCNRQLSVSYALKKDGKGERHGTEAERMLAAKGRQNQVQLPAVSLADLPMVGTNVGSNTGVSGYAPVAASALVPPPPPTTVLGTVPPPPPMGHPGMMPPPPMPNVMGMVPPPPPMMMHPMMGMQQMQYPHGMQQQAYQYNPHMHMYPPQHGYPQYPPQSGQIPPRM